MRPLARLATLGLVLLAGSCSSGDGAAQGGTDRPPAVPVTVAPVVRRDAPVTVTAIGRVQAYSTVEVKAQVEGRLAKAHFAEGQEVARGELLFTIDPRPFEAALREAEANLARDRAQQENAAVEATRFARLIKDGVVSADEYDQARTRAKALEGTVKADEAAVERAGIQLQYCSISAPIDGRLGQLLVHEGNVVKANETTLATINQLRPVYVEFAVPQQELPAIRRQMAERRLPVAASIPGANGGQARVLGELSFVNNTVDTATGTVLLKAVFANRDEALWPGQFVNVELGLATRPDAILVPARAVQTGQAGRYVFVVQADGTVASRPVVVGPATGEDVVVEEGLAPGEEVVTDGQLRLAPGVRVEVKDGHGG